MKIPVQIPAQFSDREDAKSYLLLAVNLLVVLGSGVVAWSIHTWWAYVAAFVLVGARGQACYILQHEMMHNLLFTSPAANQRAGVLTSAILGTQFHMGRKIHWDHHRNVGHDHDPNEVFHGVENRPPGMAVVRFFLFHLLGGRLFMLARNLLATAQGIVTKERASDDQRKPIIPPAKTRVDLLALFSIQLAILIGVGVLSSPVVYVLLYILPLSTLTAFFEAIRSFSEHVLPGEATCEAEQNRSFFMNASRFECFFISQFDFHYHHIHHLYPNVVTFKVRELHHWLLEHDADFLHRFMTRPSYIGTAVRYLMNKPFVGAGAGFPADALGIPRAAAE